MNASVFHRGELEMQRRTGALARSAEIGPRVIRDHMPQQHRDFFENLQFVLLAAVDATGQPWATALAGPKGFLRSPDERSLHAAAARDQADPVLRELRAGAAVGLLGMEPHTRRRNRLNGRLVAHGDSGFEVKVQMSFGNCPKYIQSRRPVAVPPAPSSPVADEALTSLDSEALQLIASADTFFIATAHPSAQALDAPPAEGVDVSHRGGMPGFVRVQGDVLLVPDFLGNSYFNTLGNLLVEPRCGLLFIDFEQGDLLHLVATGEVLQDGGPGESLPAAQRMVRFRVSAGLRRRRAFPLRWSPPEFSPAFGAPAQ